MIKARITLDRDFIIGPVPPRLFGSFVEHMGRCVYTGIHEPGHPEADERGFRGDVLDLTREMGVSIVRHPGGNFVSGYDWEDGVGPVEDRPTRLDGAWHTLETNAFGLHEFMDWARVAGVEVMEAVNLGTRGIEAARALVEYANHPSGTELSDLRRSNGAEEPFAIKLWCLGNELDGEWQIGHKTADEYGRLAQETAKAMKLVDPTIEVVAVGSSNIGMPTFGAWEHTVLGHAYDDVDYISLHAYYQQLDGDIASFLASSVDMDHFIESVAATADAVKAARRSKKTINLSFDEWNVWSQRDWDSAQEAANIESGWSEHPRLIEQTYDVADAVVVGTLLNSLLRHGDRVHIANQAQLVNVIAPIRTEPGGPSWRQSIFWPFARMAELARGQILRASVVSDPVLSDTHGEVPAVDAACTWDEAGSRLILFLANRSLEEQATTSVRLGGLNAFSVLRAEVLTIPHDGSRHSVNTADAQPVSMVPLRTTHLEGQSLTVVLPALSWAFVELEVGTS